MASVENEDCGCPDDEFAQVTAGDQDEMGDTILPQSPDPRGNTITRWRGLLAPIGVPTGDKRRFAKDSLVHRELPLPLKWQRADNQGHSASVVIGTIDGIEYGEGGAPTATGILFDPDPTQLPRLAEDVAEVRMLLEQKAIGPSVDLDDMDFQVIAPEGEMATDPGQPEKRPDIQVTRGRISSATLVAIPAFAEARPLELYQVDAEAEAPSLMASASVRSYGWSDLTVADDAQPWDAVGAVERLSTWAADIDIYAQAFLWRDADQPNALDRYRFPIADVIDDDLVIVPQALVAALDVLDSGSSELPERDQEQMRCLLEEMTARLGEMHAGLTAGAAPATPPASWYADPELDGPTPLTLTPDGRVFGHLATWGTCHIGFSPSSCVTAPRSKSNYAYFHVGEQVTAEGKGIPVGKITLGGAHADPRAGMQAAVSHYDNSTTAVATVRAGEDAYGIWVAGAITSNADEFSLAELRRSPLSGDWRRIGGRLELVAALAVNTPGFPVPRVSMVAGAQTALTAAGMLHEFHGHHNQQSHGNRLGIDEDMEEEAVYEAVHQMTPKSFREHDLPRRKAIYSHVITTAKGGVTRYPPVMAAVSAWGKMNEVAAGSGVEIQKMPSLESMGFDEDDFAVHRDPATAPVERQERAQALVASLESSGRRLRELAAAKRF